MSTSLLDVAESRSATGSSSQSPSQSTTSAATRLRTTMAAVRVAFTWFGVVR